jgi:tetratricopeptide (TPR) repeat protein
MPRRLLLFVVATGCALAQSADSDKTLQRALAMHQSGDIEGAIGAYREYLEVHPGAVEIRSNLGAALARVGRYQEAIAEYGHALDKNPANTGIRLNLALAYYKSGQFKLASEELVLVRAADGANRQVLLLLADCYLRLGDEEKVIDLLTPAQARGADDLAVDYLLGSALIRDKRPELGQILIDKILRNGDSAEARLLMGTAKMLSRDYPAALKDIERAIELNPHLPDLYSYYGAALLGAADPDGAAAAFKKELASNPNDFNSNLQLGILAKQDQKFADALSYLHRAVEVRPGNLAARYQVATVHFAQDLIEEARTELEGIIKESPEFLEAHVTLATIYYRLKLKEDGDRERATVQKLNADRQSGEVRQHNSKSSGKKDQ